MLIDRFAIRMQAYANHWPAKTCLPNFPDR